MPLSDLKTVFVTHGLSQHQAQLTFQAIHRHGELDYAKMDGVSDRCRSFLQSLPPLPSLRLEETRRAQDGAIKLRLTSPHFETKPSTIENQRSFESVIIPGPRRVTLCISCQIGCAAACAFCHTGAMGLTRNLAAWEIVEQVRVARSIERKIANLVFMGMGEPLHNETEVVQACRILNDDLGAGFSKRHITVSTAGVGDRIRSFWEQRVASLTISLHATTDAARDQLIPTLNRRWNLAALRRILLDIPWRHRETVTIAYLLLDGVNDTPDDAKRLADWCAGLPVKINLLEFNSFPSSSFRRASAEKLAAFRQRLRAYGLFNTLRRSRGDDVLAACGQLATAHKLDGLRE
ncbi:MAG: 23S rRNA (adenine(2503)-C(2))-methyltransferase RlmN [Planctomycetota bacterium]